MPLTRVRASNGNAFDVWRLLPGDDDQPEGYAEISLAGHTTRTIVPVVDLI